MKHFRYLIITRKKLRSAGVIIVASAAAIVLTKIAINRNVAVPAFSNANAADIIKEGVPQETDSFDYKEAIDKILGFDTNHPETIIESSSAAFVELEGDPKGKPKSESEPEPEPPADDESFENESENIVIPDLPSHEEIVTAKGLKINNVTNYNIDLDALCSQKSDINITKAEPEVLIIHTHTTECYIGDEMSGESERTTNEEYNMCSVGEIVSNTLQSYGIKTVHDKTIHDYPSYQGAYTRALETINKNIEQYPSIKVILDIHRDAYIYSDGSKLKVTADIEGNKAAQVMLVLGTDSMGLSHPYWQSNLRLAAKIQNAAEIMYPGMMRPLNLRRERFNMHITKGSLLLEIGSNGNSLSEAKSSAEYIGRAIAAALLNG